MAAPAQRGFRGTLGFRSAGAVELWDPLTGAATPAGVVRRAGNGSLVALDLPPSGSVFVVFRTSAKTAPSSVVRVERDGAPVADAQAPGAAAAVPQVLSASYGDPNDAARRTNVTARVREALGNGSRVTA